MNILSVLLIICITFFGLLGCYLLITRKGRRLVNYLLSIFFLIWAIDFLDGYLHLSGFYLEHVHLALWTNHMILLYGPLIYLFTRNYLSENPGLKISDLKHAIPFLLAFCLLLFGYQFRPALYKREILTNMVNMEQPKEVLYVFILVYLHFFLIPVPLGKSCPGQGTGPVAIFFPKAAAGAATAAAGNHVIVDCFPVKQLFAIL